MPERTPSASVSLMPSTSGNATRTTRTSSDASREPPTSAAAGTTKTVVAISNAAIAEQTQRAAFFPTAHPSFDTRENASRSARIPRSCRKPTIRHERRPARTDKTVLSRFPCDALQRVYCYADEPSARTRGAADERPTPPSPHSRLPDPGRPPGVPAARGRLRFRGRGRHGAPSQRRRARLAARPASRPRRILCRAHGRGRHAVVRPQRR